MPWNWAIFVAMTADKTGSRSSCVFSGRLCTQEPIRVVKGLGQEGGRVGQWRWGKSGLGENSLPGVRDVKADIGKGNRGWGRRCFGEVGAGLVLGCTVPAGPLERLRRAGAPVTALQGWRTSHFQGPRSPLPEGKQTAKGTWSQGARGKVALTHARVFLLLPPHLGLLVLLPGGSRAQALVS